MAKRGSKLNKSEAIQVRLDPILKLAATIAAENDRRSLSSYVEMAIKSAAKQSIVAHDADGAPINALDMANQCWHVIPGIQFRMLAGRCPSGLTVYERAILKAVQFISANTGYDEQWLCQNAQVWEWLQQFSADDIDFAELQKRITELSPPQAIPPVTTHN